MASRDACTTVDDERTCLTTGQMIGLTLVAEAGYISLTALAILALLVIRNVVRHRRETNGTAWNLVRTPADAYVLSLFAFDALQAIGAAMDVRWVHRGLVEVGQFCTAQGAIQQIGETGVALATMAIAIHTFVVLWMRKGAKRLDIALCIIASIWLFVLLFSIIAWRVNLNRQLSYYAPSPYWCWVGDRFLGEKIAGEYLWLWMTLLVSVMVYVPLFLWSQGVITVDQTYWWRVQFHWRPTAEKGLKERMRPDAPAMALLAYPLAYSVVVLPVSVARWIGFAQEATPRGNRVPSAATFAAVFIHDLFGAVNVLLLLTTRPGLLLFDEPNRSRARRGSNEGRAPSLSPGRSSVSSRRIGQCTQTEDDSMRENSVRQSY